MYWPLREGEWSRSAPKDGGSDTTGVKETSGGAALDGTTVRDEGRSGGDGREGKEEPLFAAVADGRLCSPMVAPGGPDGVTVEEDKGTAKLFFIRENKEVTRA